MVQNTLMVKTVQTNCQNRTRPHDYGRLVERLTPFPKPPWDIQTPGFEMVGVAEHELWTYWGTGQIGHPTLTWRSRW